MYLVQLVSTCRLHHYTHNVCPVLLASLHPLELHLVRLVLQVSILRWVCCALVVLLGNTPLLALVCALTVRRVDRLLLDQQAQVLVFLALRVFMQAVGLHVYHVHRVH